MRQYRGCIEVDSEPGKGTSFTLCFPSLQSFGAPLRPAGPPWSDEAIPV